MIIFRVFNGSLKERTNLIKMDLLPRKQLFDDTEEQIYLQIQNLYLKICKLSIKHKFVKIISIFNC